MKNYKGIDLNKYRPVLVISDNEKLIDRCLIVEMSTHCLNEYSIELSKYFSKRHKIEKTSYILPDRIHTINRKYLKNRNRI
ncbi:MAG: type II toxin-antitoxin system PemK/MazF family toxin [Elusimicrobiota bacterium]|nr:type II toxin-antitoxin system PemK/MazF family toxin [Elusimicrobiota bacterium]